MVNYIMKFKKIYKISQSEKHCRLGDVVGGGGLGLVWWWFVGGVRVVRGGVGVVWGWCGVGVGVVWGWCGVGVEVV